MKPLQVLGIVLAMAVIGLSAMALGISLVVPNPPPVSSRPSLSPAAPTGPAPVPPAVPE